MVGGWKTSRIYAANSQSELRTQWNSDLKAHSFAFWLDFAPCKLSSIYRYRFCFNIQYSQAFSNFITMISHGNLLIAIVECRCGNLQLLCEGLKLIRAASPDSVGVQPEFLASSSEVDHFLALMEKARSPLKKLENLLGAMTALSARVSCYCSLRRSKY